jgi:ABC-2 type transport system permease protein
MTVFKAFLRILARNKWVILMYSAILITFSVFSLQANESTVTFEAVKPDLCIINHDAEEGITKSLFDYLSANNNIIDLPVDDPDAISDALFYRKINYLVEIPAGFRDDFLAGRNPAITTRSTGDYNASLAEMNLTRFLNVANQYLATAASSGTQTVDEAALIKNLEATLATEVDVQLTSSLDTTSLDRAAFYYNFMNYPLLVGCIYIVATVMLSFRDEKISRRIAMGGVTPEHVNRILLAANALFALALWLSYVLISFVVVGPVMFSLHGLWLILNSFVFTLCATALAFLIANLLRSRNAINGITNVVALGSSFLCGAFVPITWLPDGVVVAAHVLPSYWYISANDLITTLETFTFDSLQPVILHLLVILAFAALFTIIANLLSHRRK